MKKRRRTGAKKRLSYQPTQFEALESRQMLSAAFPTSLGPTPPTDLGILPIAVNITPPSGLYANHDGSGNNVDNIEWGSTNTQLLRLTSIEYADGISELAGEDRASAREISNLVADQEESILNDRYLTNMLWVFGQFIDHDIDLTTGADPAEEANIEVPQGDIFFDPFNTGAQEIGLSRSVYDTETGDESGDPRQQLNTITSFLDGSVIYGSDQETADSLREFSGGRMLTSDGDLLPTDEFGHFLAGDIRANENIGLIAMQTVWMREHNHWADRISTLNPNWTDQQVYEQARSIVIAELQAVTYNEFLPALLGTGAISEYQGYDEDVNPGIANVFSTAAYRFGHSMLSSELQRLNADGSEADEGNIELRDAFFNPTEIADNGIESILRGVAWSQAQEIDNQVVDDVRNFLFGPPGAGGFDLASLNIQRGRDHGLADYNQTRIDYGLEAVTSFADISSDPDVQAALEAAYGSVDDIDVWVGGLAEDHVPGGSMGELFSTIIADQFERIRDGDRFWYQNVYQGKQLQQIESTTLAEVIQRNTEIDNLQDQVFFDPSVLVVDMGGRARGNVTVTVQDGNVVVLGPGRRVIQSVDAADLSQIVLRGNSDRADRVTIDLRDEGLDLEGGIVVYGHDGRGDSVAIRTGSGDDTITVDGNELNVNGTTVAFHDVERININAGRGENDVTVGDDVDARVHVERTQPRRGPLSNRTVQPRRGGGNNGGPNLQNIVNPNLPDLNNNGQNVLNQLANMGPFSLIEVNVDNANNNRRGGRRR